MDVIYACIYHRVSDFPQGKKAMNYITGLTVVIMSFHKVSLGKLQTLNLRVGD